MINNPKVKKFDRFKSLAVYWLAKEIYYLNHIFCQRYIFKASRTFEQMIQAGRSGKQNIVEGSLEKSTESNPKFTGVSRTSYGELVEDYEDFLWLKDLPVWDKENSRHLHIRKNLINRQEPRVTHKFNVWNEASFADPEYFANLMITLCTKQGYLYGQVPKENRRKFCKNRRFPRKLAQKASKVSQEF